MEGELPGCEEVLLNCTPATRPANALAGLTTCALRRSSAFKIPAEPVKASLVVLPKATTTTSSSAWLSSCNTIWRLFRFPGLIVWVTKPT